MTDGAPAYLALAEQLGELVGTLEPGARLPSEHELVAEHGVSRLTARAALQELEARFLVRRVRGSGTFVARRVALRLGEDLPLSVDEAIRRAGADVASDVTSIRTRRPSAWVRDALDLDADERVVTVTRAGKVDGLAASYGSTHLPSDLVPDLGSLLGGRPSLHALLRDEYDIESVRLWARAELAVVPGDVAPHLGLEGRPLAWRLETCSHAPRLGRPVLLSQRWLRADVHRVVLEVGRPD